MIYRSYRYFWPMAYLGLAAFVVLLSVVVWVLAERLAVAEHKTESRSDLAMEMHHASIHLEDSVSAGVAILKALAAIVTTEPDITQERFAELASLLMAEEPVIRHVATAPDLVIKNVYPTEGNEAALGLDYRTVPEQMVAIERAITTGGPVLAGPVTLVQGGEAFIMRAPVFVATVGSDQPALWGVLSAVIDADSLFREAGLVGEELPFEIAIKGRDGFGAAGDVFVGQSYVHEGEPVFADVSLPGGSWQIAAIPSGGWVDVPDSLTWIRLWIALGGAAVMIAVFSAARLVQQRLVAEARSPDGGTVGFRVDITELKNAIEEAEEANRAKSDFLNVMSHELRTPLTVILGFNSFLSSPKVLPSVRRFLGSLDDEAIDAAARKVQFEGVLAELSTYSKKMNTSGQHLLTLINDMLDLSKIEAEEMKFDLKTIAVDPVIEAIANEFRQSAQSKGLDLAFDASGEKVIADERRLKQMLINLVGNAIKFTDAGRITISARRNGRFVEFSVTDTGRGIPEDQQALVFERFKQVDASVTRQAGGTGLGLAITKRLAELHNGEIGMSSIAGQGSTFWFTIPAAD